MTRGLFRDLCASCAQAMGADVASLYLRERVDHTDWLVMRGNVGFASEAVRDVRLPMGQGITGFAAERQRPVFAQVASEVTQYRPVSGLGEERFPVFLAVPLLTDGRTEGVLVLQRRGSESFDEHDVRLASALVGLMRGAIQRAHAGTRGSEPPPGRRVTLNGVGLGAGPEVYGSAVTLPTLVSLEEPSEPKVDEAFDRVVRTVQKGLKRATDLGVAADSVGSLLLDQRFRNLIATLTEERGLTRGLREAIRQYALAPLRLGLPDDPANQWMSERAAEVGQLSLLVGAEACHAMPECNGRVLVVADPPSVVLSVFAVARGVRAVLIADHFDPASPAARFLHHAGIPTLHEVGGLFDWVRPDDPLLVNDVAGTVRVQPNERDVVRVRRGLPVGESRPSEEE